MDSASDIRAFVDHRIGQLLREERQYRIKLSIYGWLSWICVAVGIVVPLLVGSALLASPAGFGPRWGNIAGALALLAAILTGLHKGFKCEAYHDECRRQIHTLRSIVEGLEATVVLEGQQLSAEVETLEARLRDLRAGAFGTPPRRRLVSTEP